MLEKMLEEKKNYNFKLRKKKREKFNTTESC